jgi:hypothetical protein
MFCAKDFSQEQYVQSSERILDNVGLIDHPSEETRLRMDRRGVSTRFQTLKKVCGYLPKNCCQAPGWGRSPIILRQITKAFSTPRHLSTYINVM